ncbi:MAG TPA: ArgE/DapE family deacylase [Thermodesulfobacteriota bacterium]
MTPHEPVVERLRDLVAIESVNPFMDASGSGEAGVADYLAATFRRLGLEVERREVYPAADGRPARANLVARLAGREPGPGLLFEAHMDTVPAVTGQVDPFTPRIVDGRLEGRGACDCKGAMAAMVEALARVTQGRERPRRDVWFVGAVDEEYTHTGIAALVDAGIAAAGAVVGEPTDLAVVVAHKGVLRFRLHVSGRAAHSSRPSEGVNAILKMAALLRGLEERLPVRFAARKHSRLGEPTWNAGRMAGGLQANIVPDAAWVDIDRRLVPGETAATALEEFREAALEVARAEGGLEFRFDPPYLVTDPLETPDDAPVVRAAAAAVRAAGGESRLAGVPYGTDGSFLARAGIPAVVLGPGSIDLAHSARESVPLDQVVAAVAVYERIILNGC